jgi:hypothetical protein
MVCFDDIAIAVGRRDRGAEALPLFREQHSPPTAEPPVELLAPAGRDAEQDDLRDAIRVSFGVGESQYAAPRPPDHQPSIDIEVLT